MRSWLNGVSLSILLLASGELHAQIDDLSVVYIECFRDEVRVSRGSGVIVGDRGEILTATHVVPDDSSCLAVRGTAAEIPTRRLVGGAISSQYDARIMRFVPKPNEIFIAVPFTELDESLKNSTVVAFGFPFDGTGEIEARSGSIAAIVPKSNGTIPTTTLTVRGMSGGAVVDSGGKLVGIVAGASYDPTSGNYTSFGVLAAQLIATELDLQGDLPGRGSVGHGGRSQIQGVIIPAGSFQMGTPETEAHRADDEGPMHSVSISRPFWMSATEITQGQWTELIDDNPSYFVNCGSDCPVDSVNWWQAVAWLNKRSEAEGLPSCYRLYGCTPKDPGNDGYTCQTAVYRGPRCTGYRLPTEAEWEYAARAGATTPLYEGDLVLCGKNCGRGLNPIAWYGGNSGVRYEGAVDCSFWPDAEIPANNCGTHPVGTKKPNAFGLYDVLGNVMEWVLDNPDRYSSGPVVDPYNLADGDNKHERISRGGAWDWDARYMRLGNRSPWRGDYNARDTGFRAARSLIISEKSANFVDRIEE